MKSETPAHERIRKHDPAEIPSALFRQPYDRLRAEIDALDESTLLPLNFDIASAITTALGVIPVLQSMRSQIVALPGIDHKQFDRLEDYVHAAAYTQGRYLIATTPVESLPTLNVQAVKLRDSLLLSAETLVDHNLLPAEQIVEIRTGQGYRSTSMDLVALSELFRAGWASIAGRTAVVPEDLDLADSLAERLLVAVGKRDQTDPAVAAASLERRRAVTLFVRAYDQARRAVTFLRWDVGDVDTVVPSLYAHTGPAPKKSATTTAPDAPGANTAPVAGAGADTNAPPVVASAHVAAAAPPAGVPQSNPFSRG